MKERVGVNGLRYYDSSLVRNGVRHSLTEIHLDGFEYAGAVLIDGVRYIASSWRAVLDICDRHQREVSGE